jgi:hypothetical protein
MFFDLLSVQYPVGTTDEFTFASISQSSRNYERVRSKIVLRRTLGDWFRSRLIMRDTRARAALRHERTLGMNRIEIGARP